jgi:hypothetical protein
MRLEFALSRWSPVGMTADVEARISVRPAS